MSTESWRPVPGFEGAYEASDAGNVRSVARTVARPPSVMKVQARVLRQKTLRGGHRGVTLSLDGVRYTRLVHHLVLEAFVGTRPAGTEGLHRDDDGANNVLSNLRWGTRSENLDDAVRNGGHFQASKTHCPRNHLLTDANNLPSAAARGHRTCRACHRAMGYARRTKSPFDPALADRHFAALTA